MVQTADASKLTAIYSGQGVYLARIELLHKIRKAQFSLGRFRMQSQAASAVWNAILAA